MNHIFMISRLASSIQSFQKGTNGKNAASHSRHFDRSEVEKSHAPNDRKAGPRPPSFRPKRSGVEKSPSLMVRAALRREISRLRVSSKRFPSAPYRHAAPLEMTMVASAPLVISTVAQRSGEVSPSDGTGGITAGDLSTQSIMGAFSICPIPTRSPARDDDGGERPSSSFRPKRSGVEKSHASDGTGDITVGDLSTQSIMGAFSICPIPTRSPARDDGVGERPSRHFDRSEAEWRNLTPPMTEKPARALRHFGRSGVEKSHASIVQEAWRQEISGSESP